MRILFFADLKGYSHDKKWIRYFASQPDIECFVISLKENYNKLTADALDDFASANISVLKPIDSFSLRNFFRTLKGLLYILQVIKHEKIDLIHVMYVDPNALWAVFKVFLKRPIIMTTRGSDLNVGLQSVVARRGILKRILFSLYKKAFQNAEYITCTSRDQIEKMKLFFSLGEKFRLIRTGAIFCNPKKNSQLVLDKISKKKFIFFPRSQRPVYNHEFAIDAIKKLPSEILKDYSFVFVNKDSTDTTYVSKISQLMEESSKRITWDFLPTLDQEEIAILYRMSSLVVMTPRSDGSPVSAMEAMMYKVPVILPPINYDDEIFNNTAFIFETWDSIKLAELMSELLNDANLCNDKVAKAYVTVMEKGNFYKEMEKMLTIYKSLD